ncbi:MAG TPA: hypothetical protein VF221_22745 [Chloroflexota bacterium]
MRNPAFYIVLGFTAAAAVASWDYSRRFQLARPPIGVMTLGDVAVMIGATIVVPYLYLRLPLWLVAGLFALGVLLVLYTMAEPVLHARWAIWLVALILLATDMGTNARFGATSLPFLLANNVVLTLVIVGVANLWAQSGTKARDVALLAGTLGIYDVIATSFLPVTNDLFHHLAGMPLTPMLAWGSGSNQLGIGLGDVLLATVFPLVMRKAFGRTAGLVAAALSLCAIALMATALALLDIRAAIPVMAALGPLMLLQYRYWMRRQGSDRTTWQYVRAELYGSRAPALPITIQDQSTAARKQQPHHHPARSLRSS